MKMQQDQRQVVAQLKFAHFRKQKTKYSQRKEFPGHTVSINVGALMNDDLMEHQEVFF
jgi:hypothetical protein